MILIDQDTQSVVYSQSFPSTRDLTIDLAEEDLDDGTYTLRVYAFGKWWIGEFELEDVVFTDWGLDNKWQELFEL